MGIIGFRRQGQAADGVHAVEANAVLRLPRGRGVSLRVEEGQVVVTRAGDPRDHVLEAGAVMDLSGSDRALAWALRPSRIELRRAAGRADERAEVVLVP